MDGIMDGVLYERRRADRAEEQLAALREENARLRAVLDRLLTTFIGIGSDGEQLTPEAYGPALADALDFARAALAPEVKPGSACADRAETVEQTHARWSAQPPEVKP